MTKEELLDKCVEFSIKINKLRKYLRERVATRFVWIGTYK